MITPAVLGIDPGVRGGIVVLDDLGKIQYVAALKPEMHEREAVACVREAVKVLNYYPFHACYMEKVGHHRGDGGLGTFTFGKITGILRGSILTHGLIIRDVTPALWQSKMECLTGGNKNISKRRAQEMFPMAHVTHYNADALLIASYGQRMQSL